MVLDQAGWHGAVALRVPDCITLVPLPPYSPELNPVEWVWEYMKERFLSLRLLNDYDAIADAVCKAWNRLLAETGRITSHQLADARCWPQVDELRQHIRHPRQGIDTIQLTGLNQRRGHRPVIPACTVVMDQPEANCAQI